MPDLSAISPAVLARLRVLAVDIDGVLTDGRVWPLPGGGEAKALYARDGTGVKYWVRAGHVAVAVSGGPVDAVAPTLRAWGFAAVVGEALVKTPALFDALARLPATPDETVYVGDDWPDRPPMRHCAVSVAVADAADDIRAAADVVTAAPGGRGAVRELVEAVLKAQGRWEAIVARYAE